MLVERKEGGEEEKEERVPTRRRWRAGKLGAEDCLRASARREISGECENAESIRTDEMS